MKHLQCVNFSPTVGKAKGADEGESKHNDSKETTTEENLVHGFPPRRQLLRDLSRVSEEAFMSRASSSTDNRNDMTGGIWDPETGGSNGMDYSDDSSKDDKDPNGFIRSLSPWPGSLESKMRIKQGGASGRSLTSGGLEHINETREHSGQRKSRGRGKFSVRSPFTRSPQIGSIDHSSEGEKETSTTSRSMPHSALPLSSASSTLRTIYPHRPSRSLSRTGPTIGGGAKSNEGDIRGTVPTESRTRSLLHDVSIYSRIISRHRECVVPVIVRPKLWDTKVYLKRTFGYQTVSCNGSHVFFLGKAPPGYICRFSCGQSIGFLFPALLQV